MKKHKKTHFIISITLLVLGVLLALVMSYLASQDSKNGVGPNIGFGLLYLFGILIAIIGVIYFLLTLARK